MAFSIFSVRAIRLYCIVLGLSNAMAGASLPQIDYSNVSGFTAGEVPDGMVIGRGRVSNTGMHQGFSVWLESALKGNEPGHYILQGKTNSRNMLRVRLEEYEWQKDNESTGIRILTTNQTASFFVVTDGNQYVHADTWSLELRATSQEP